MPQRKLPNGLIAIIASFDETFARMTGRPMLLGSSTYQIMKCQSGKTNCNRSRIQREFGLSFRSIEPTLSDEIGWIPSTNIDQEEEHILPIGAGLQL